MLRKDADFEAFERVMAEAHQRQPIRVLSYCVMSNHWHKVVCWVYTAQRLLRRRRNARPPSSPTAVAANVRDEGSGTLLMLIVKLSAFEPVPHV
jgi:hypothetical protein